MKKNLPFKVPEGYFKAQENYWMNYSNDSKKQPKKILFPTYKTFWWAAAAFVLVLTGILFFDYMHRETLKEKGVNAVYALYFEEHHENLDEDFLVDPY